MRQINYTSNQRGTMYLEALTAFLVWTIILTMVLPTFFRISFNRQELLINNEATSILTEQVIKWSRSQSLEEFIEGNYSEYKITLDEMEGITTICVHFKRTKEKQDHVCRTVE